MKTINFLFVIFLILGALFSTSLSSRLRKFDSYSNENDYDFLEEASNEDSDLDAYELKIKEAGKKDPLIK